MSDNSKNMSAFPFVVPGTYQHINPGMTLRDYFAAKAMQGMMMNSMGYTTSDVANYAYRIADLMLEERDK